MVKLVFLCRRRADISHERYAALLLDGHVPLALRHHPTLRRYVVNIVEDALGAAPPLDSIGHLWFDTLADFHERLYDTPEGERIIQRDVAGFMEGADALVTEERVLLAPPTPPELGTRSAAAKLVLGLRAATMFDRPPPAALGCVLSVVQARLGGGGPDWDAFLELWAEPQRIDEVGQAAGPSLGGALAAAYRVAEYVQRV
jgi:uncharacterized protein (TIGR02118 family)